MRCTKKLLIKLVNEKLKELELPFKVTDIKRSRFNSEQYQCGAWFWKAVLKSTEGIDYVLATDIYSYIPFIEFETQLNKGEKIKIKDTSRSGNGLLTDLEITI